MIKLTPEKPPYYENVGQTKVYEAILNQTGTNDPIPIVLKNTLGEQVTWERISTGIYTATKTTEWPENKTTVIITSGADPFVIQARRQTPENYVAVYAFDNTWTAVDEITQATIRITTY